MDQNKDGKISAEEFESKGVDALPNFNDLGAEGHHYDMESGMSGYKQHLTLLDFLARILSPS